MGRLKWYQSNVTNANARSIKVMLWEATILTARRKYFHSVVIRSIIPNPYEYEVMQHQGNCARATGCVHQRRKNVTQRIMGTDPCRW